MNDNDLGTDNSSITLAELTGGATLSCIDGRHEHQIVGAPGGNMGEFILLITALDASGTAVEPDDVAGLLDGYVREFGRFYMHTDRAALDWIASQLGRERIEAQDIEEAPDGQWSDLLAMLTDRRGIGCGHINAMLGDPETYRIRPELVRAAIRAFFDEIWNYDTDADLDYTVLEGEHEEEELVIYEAEAPDELTDTTRVPLGSTEGGSKFVLHDVARRYLLQRSVDYFARRFELDADARDEFARQLQAIADVQLEATRQALFPTLPTRVVRI